ncbi:hypothetical protein [Clostridium beijerinckii]|uniref:hypothetical protein n=1 Tax=Clostridium beijerinckii TaxID=1520 RepID=UPI00242A48BB|nr:hypothetical protein [Clostridium beijerinckii]MDG5857081.1 hypothetical protein [Clostridium beijerinckii]
MKENVIITGYKDMCFESGEGDKKQSVDFLKLTCLSKNSGVDAIGYLPLQLTYMDKEKAKIIKSLTFVPGLYEAEYAMVPGKNNKPSLQIVGFTPVKELHFESMFNEK